jgi:glycosyltransferase involved in cell wall biosynthesis
VKYGRTVGLLYGHRLDVGGVESHILSLVSRSDRARWHWRVVAPTTPSFAARATEAGAEVEHWAPRHALDAAALRALVRCHRARPVDLRHVHDPRSLPVAQAAAIYQRIPLVYTVHLPIAAGDTGDGAGGKPRRRLQSTAERLLLRLAPPSRIVHVSARALARAASRSNGNLVHVPNGVDLGRAAAPGTRERVRAARGVSAEACVATSVARLVPQKGLDLLLEAWAQGALGGASTHLWLAGEGPEREALEARVARLGIGGSVALLGRREDVPDVLAATDVFVLASREETTPIALLEAMAAGRACVATDVGDCRAMLGDGAAGRVVAPGDVAGLAAALREVVGDGVLRERLGIAAHERAQLFGDVAMAARTAGVYEVVLAAGHASKVTVLG